MQQGSKGPDVQAWQHLLNTLRYTGVGGRALVEDGVFGDNTDFATKAFQRALQLTPDGIVTQALLAGAQAEVQAFEEEPSTDPGNNASPSLLPYIFIPARNYTPANRTRVDLIVIHTMEAPEKPKTAIAVASWFASASSPKASAHFCVDDADTIQCVRESDIAWHAPGANNNGIGVEHAGYASQTPADWSDAYSLAVLANSSRLVASLCKRWNIPVVRLTPADLNAKARGICGHIDCTNAFSNGKGHFDPGPAYPWVSYLAAVSAELTRLTSIPPARASRSSMP